MLPTAYSLFAKVSPTPLVTPVLTVHANYVSGDYVGTSASPMEFTGCGSYGWLVGATLFDYAVQSLAAELWVFNAAITPPNDSAAWAISDADILKCVAVIPFVATDYYASSNNSICSGIPKFSKKYSSASGSLFGCIVTRGAPTYASGDVSVSLSILRGGDR